MATLALGTTSVVSGLSYAAANLVLAGYTGLEKSLSNSGPEELYLFNEDDTNFWVYTSSHRNIDYGGRTYLAQLIKRGDISLHSN